jgi:hypothetical protein
VTSVVRVIHVCDNDWILFNHEFHKDYSDFVGENITRRCSLPVPYIATIGSMSTINNTITLNTYIIWPFPVEPPNFFFRARTFFQNGFPKFFGYRN